MSSADQFWTVLGRLQRQSNITLNIKRKGSSLTINGITFNKISRLGFIKIALPPFSGILVNKITADEEKRCKLNNVSFLTSSGQLYLIGKDYKLNLELMPHKKSEEKQKKIEIGKRRGVPSPTALISPNGLGILDVLFRLAPEKLTEFKSALSFTQEFHLSQPKLSLMMKELGVNSLLELKTKIKSLPDSWWESALRYSMTKKGLLPFFGGEKMFRSLKTNLPKQEILQDLSAWLSSRNDLLHGPVEVVKSLGLIRDEDIYLWGSPAAAQEIKNSFKLIPDRKIQETNWQIAVLPIDFGKGAVLSPLVDKTRSFYMSEIKTNLFRSIWDLGFGDERLQEVQLLALRRILNAV